MGEGGVRMVEPSVLRALRELCDQNGLLLIFDEVTAWGAPANCSLIAAPA